MALTLVSGGGPHVLIGFKTLAECLRPLRQRLVPFCPFTCKTQIEITDQRRKGEMSAMQLLAGFRQVGVEMIQTLHRLFPLLVDPWLVNSVFRAGTALVNDGQQAIHDAVAERFQNFRFGALAVLFG